MAIGLNQGHEEHPSEGIGMIEIQKELKRDAGFDQGIFTRSSQV
jgi:hypothetical protein